MVHLRGGWQKSQWFTVNPWKRRVNHWLFWGGERVIWKPLSGKYVFESIAAAERQQNQAVERQNRHSRHMAAQRIAYSSRTTIRKKWCSKIPHFWGASLCFSHLNDVFKVVMRHNISISWYITICSSACETGHPTIQQLKCRDTDYLSRLCVSRHREISHFVCVAMLVFVRQRIS